MTGEYAVLKGANALALPTKLGQHLIVKPSSSPKVLSWIAKDEKDNTWFNCTFSLETMSLIDSSDLEVSKRLLKMLTFCKSKSSFINEGSFEVTTKNEFPNNYGLGTSSTLINNLAYWANIDPFPILKECFSGSGFDLAVAQCNDAVNYKLSNNQPNWQKEEVSFPFKDNLFFVHLNQKAVSRNSIKGKIEFSKEQLRRISEISNSINKVNSLAEFEMLLNDHEVIISQAIGKTPIKRALFPSFDRTIKSLGAWGGDFILATGEKTYVEKFFRSRGYNSIFKYSELILKS